MAGPRNFTVAWQERLSALRNVPAVLRIVWDSGRTVVTLGLFFRVIASFLPIALLWVTKLIIDSIVRAVTTHQAVPTPPLVAGGGGVLAGRLQQHPEPHHRLSRRLAG